MILPWTWYFPDMRKAPSLIELYEEKDFAAMRRAGIKFWDVNHKQWCYFPDNFKEELYLKGVLQTWTPPAPKPKAPPPTQPSLF